MRLAHSAFPRHWLVACLVLTACTNNAELTIGGRSYHVATTGSASGDGSAGKPWDLTTALAHPGTVQPNDTIWLHGGTYKGNFLSALAGAEKGRITLREAAGEHAVVDGSLEVRGQYTTYWGFEVMNSDPVRFTQTAGSDPADYKRQTAVVLHGRNTKLINLTIHDAGSGVGMWMPAIDAEVYGCIIYNNGWQGPDRGYGVGIAAQNESGTKQIRDNIVFQQFNDGINIYGSDESLLKGFNVEGNVSFDNGLPSKAHFATDIFIGGGTPTARLTVSNNSTYRSDGLGTVRFGYEPAIVNEDLVLANNYFVGQTAVANWKKVSANGNTFTGAQNLIEVRMPPGVPLSAYEWDGNAYLPDRRRRALNSTMPIVAIEHDTGRGFEYKDWVKSTGRDRGGRASPKPSGVQTFVRANQYERGRGHIVVYNWDHAAQVSVDLSSVLEKGDAFEIRNVYDLKAAPVVTGEFAGGRFSFMKSQPIVIPLSAPVTPTQVLGLEPFAAGSNPPEFAVFLVSRVTNKTP